MTSPTPDRSRAGRSLDTSRDEDILGAALELLVEQGYERVTIEAIAARARAGKATIYRRWSSKAELYVEAVHRLKAPMSEPPDTGSVVEDVRKLFLTATPDDRGFMMMRGLANAVHRDAGLAATFREKFFRPRRALLETILQRGVDRGEIPSGRDIDLVANVFPALMLHRMILGGEAPDREYVTRVVDHLVLPLMTAPLSAYEQPEGKP